jgi:hypothetical protein
MYVLASMDIDFIRLLPEEIQKEAKTVININAFLKINIKQL